MLCLVIKVSGIYPLSLINKKKNLERKNNEFITAIANIYIRNGLWVGESGC